MFLFLGTLLGIGFLPSVRATSTIDHNTQYDKAKNSRNFDDGKYKFCFAIALDTEKVDQNDHYKEYCYLLDVSRPVSMWNNSDTVDPNFSHHRSRGDHLPRQQDWLNGFLPRSSR